MIKKNIKLVLIAALSLVILAETAYIIKFNSDLRHASEETAKTEETAAPKETEDAPEQTDTVSEETAEETADE